MTLSMGRHGFLAMTYVTAKQHLWATDITETRAIKDDASCG